MSFKLIAQYETRGTPVGPKPSKEVERKILRYLTQNRRIHPIGDISEHIRETEAETKTFMDILGKKWSRIKYVSQDGIRGYIFETHSS